MLLYAVFVMLRLIVCASTFVHVLLLKELEGSPFGQVLILYQHSWALRLSHTHVDEASWGACTHSPIPSIMAPARWPLYIKFFCLWSTITCYALT